MSFTFRCLIYGGRDVLWCPAFSGICCPESDIVLSIYSMWIDYWDRVSASFCPLVCFVPWTSFLENKYCWMIVDVQVWQSRGAFCLMAFMLVFMHYPCFTYMFSSQNNLWNSFITKHFGLLYSIYVVSTLSDLQLYNLQNKKTFRERNPHRA